MHKTMKTIKVLIYSIFTILGIHSMNAQQDLLLSQEIFSRINKNPAGTGNTNDIDIFLHGRIQWAGIENGPRSGVINVTNYVDKIKSGMGLTCSFDKIGMAHNTTNIKAVYAYQIDLSEKLVLSLGLGAGIYYGYYDAFQNQLFDASEYGDETYPENKESKVSPDFDFGTELSNPYWTFGASITHLTKSEMTTFESERHYYVYGTSLLPLNEIWELAPTISYMHRHKTNVMELGSFAFYNRLLWGGLTIRPDLSSGFNPSMMVITLGVEWNKIRFGYSCDIGLGSNERIDKGTHEITLSYGFDKAKFKKR